MFWMFPDAWGEIGWSLVDYYLRKKASYDYVRRASAPVLVSIKEEECGVSTWVVNDTLAPIKGKLVCRLMSFDGTVRSETTESVEIPANASVCCNMERMTLMRSGDFSHARLMGADDVVAENIFLFMNFKSVKMAQAEVVSQIIEREGARAVLRLSSNVFAHFVRMDFPAGLEADDICFDLLPGESRDVLLRGDISDLDSLRVRWRNQDGE